MFVKRILLSAVAAVCAVALLAPAAFAHGGCHGRRAVRQTAQPCAVEDCTLTGWHYHSRTLYCGHTHNGTGLCDGSCYPLCPVESCTQAGRHVHSGVTYCGAEHGSGWCDGTCPYYQAPASSGVRCGGHHGCR